ncbi:MAG TPA: DUF4199 domain-containing protein [Salinimicrobium sp.]|nr:DUF4199 domain-containing protein [Salinimicrobium sp.]
METQSPKTSKFILNYGILLGIISVVLGVIMYVTNSYLDPSWIYIVISLAISIAILFIGIKAFKTENGGFLSLGEALKVGVGISLISGIITSIWSFLLMTVIEPTYMDQMMDMQREKMAERGMAEAQIDAAMEMSAGFMSPWISIAIQLAVGLFFGLIIALIIGLILRQKNPHLA